VSLPFDLKSKLSCEANLPEAKKRAKESTFFKHNRIKKKQKEQKLMLWREFVSYQPVNEKPSP